jgi:hypothetical protein
MLAASLVRGSSQAAAQTSGSVPATIANAAGIVNAIMQELMNQMGFLQAFGIQPTIRSIADGSKVTADIIGGEIDCTMMTGFSQNGALVLDRSCLLLVDLGGEQIADDGLRLGGGSQLPVLLTPQFGERRTSSPAKA